MKKTNKKPKEPVLPHLYIHFNQYQDGGEICAGEENDSYPSREDTNYTYTYKYARRSAPTGNDVWSSGTQTLKVSPQVFSADKIFLAIVVYSDGDTFGNSFGHHEIIGGYSTRKEAEEVLECVTKEGLNIPGYEGYCNWCGYFNSIQDKIVEKLDIEE